VTVAVAWLPSHRPAPAIAAGEWPMPYL